MNIDFDWWPFMLKSSHEEVRRENFHLRGALGAANAELRKHRLLLGHLKNGEPTAMAAVERAIERARSAP